MNDGYKLLDLTLIHYLFLPGRKRLDGEVLDHKLFPYIIRCCVLLWYSILWFYIYLWNSHFNRLKTNYFIFMIKWYLLVLIISMFLLFYWLILVNIISSYLFPSYQSFNCFLYISPEKLYKMLQSKPILG